MGVILAPQAPINDKFGNLLVGFAISSFKSGLCQTFRGFDCRAKLDSSTYMTWSLIGHRIAAKLQRYSFNLSFYAKALS